METVKSRNTGGQPPKLPSPSVTAKKTCVIIGGTPPHRHRWTSARTTMIERYSDRAANERTFLAWVRTAIAIMAFGFLVERFDVFLQLAAPSLSERTLSELGQTFGNVAG